MGNLRSYIDWVEFETFFSAFILIYALSYSFFKTSKPHILSKISLAYAFTGTVYLGSVLKSMYPHYNFDSFNSDYAWYKLWALLSLLFWLKPFRKFPLLAALHSLVFFFLIIKDAYTEIFVSHDRQNLHNDLKIFTASILINIFSLVVVVLASGIISRFRKNAVAVVKN